MGVTAQTCSRQLFTELSGVFLVALGALIATTTTVHSVYKLINHGFDEPDLTDCPLI